MATWPQVAKECVYTRHTHTHKHSLHINRDATNRARAARIGYDDFATKHIYAKRGVIEVAQQHSYSAHAQYLRELKN